MWKSKIVLGINLEQDIENALSRIDSNKIAFFINDSGQYLQKIPLENHVVVGKFLPEEIAFNELENSCAHILSIFKKILPNRSFNNSDIYLYPWIQTD